MLQHLFVKLIIYTYSCICLCIRWNKTHAAQGLVSAHPLEFSEKNVSKDNCCQCHWQALPVLVQACRSWNLSPKLMLVKMKIQQLFYPFWANQQLYFCNLVAESVHCKNTSWFCLCSPFLRCKVQNLVLSNLRFEHVANPTAVERSNCLSVWQLCISVGLQPTRG